MPFDGRALFRRLDSQQLTDSTTELVIPWMMPQIAALDTFEMLRDDWKCKAAEASSLTTRCEETVVNQTTAGFGAGNEGVSTITSSAQFELFIFTQSVQGSTQDVIW